VLVVDDNPTMRSLLAQQLTEAGLVATPAGDGPGALAALQAAQQSGQPFDLALLDSDAPGMDGLAVAEAIKADPALAPTPLVLLAPVQRSAGGRAALSTLFAAALAKPVRRRQLWASLAGVFAAHHRDDRPTDGPVPVGEPAPVGGGGSALVVEDNRVNRQVTAQILKKHGWSVDAVANGREAVEAVAHRQYDLVFMDCQMPEMDGYMATAAIRVQEGPQPAHRLPIIAVTAHTLASDAARCLAAGMDDYLAKPVTPEQVAAVLARWTPARSGTPPRRSPGGTEGQALLVDPTVSLRLRSVHAPGMPDLLTQLVEIFLHDAPGDIAALGNAVARADLQAVQDVAHSLKGSCGTLGAVALDRLCGLLEAQAQARDYAALTATLASLGETFSATCAALSILLAQQTEA
jgi:CheY-like chemotaxis protein/HPt (histidine-containing phosphotransfer) domain-containing protein